MQTRSVAVIGAGEMGSAVAARLRDGGCSVVLSVQGRSNASRERAAALGIETVETALELVARANLILSIVPPAQARPAAELVAEAVRRTAATVTYVDCNAISPATVGAVEALFGATQTSFVDAGIIGGPPVPNNAGPIVFVSGPYTAAVIGLRDAGLDVRALGPSIGSASALKLSYAGITKGLTALCGLMQDHAANHGLRPQLDAVLAETRPDLWNFLAGAVPAMYPKSYRWIAEMREIAAYTAPDKAADHVYEGAAQYFERISAARTT